MRQMLLRVEFDGADFAGFQPQQAGVRTVGGCLQDAWQRWLGEKVVARTSSRTDAGVHGRRMPVLIRAERMVPPRALVLGFNSHLPVDVAITDAREVPLDFDVRSDAFAKRYVYRVWASQARSPLSRRRAWHVTRRLDLAAMDAAAAHLKGEHDFSAMRAAGCTAQTAVRLLWRVDVDSSASPLIVVTVEGNAFLRNMVRILAGTLIDAGTGRIPADEVPTRLASGRRDQVGQTAPAWGLTLDEVFFGPAGARWGHDHALLTNRWQRHVAAGELVPGDPLT